MRPNPFDPLWANELGLDYQVKAYDTNLGEALKPDCANCAALCCVALHIEKSSQFPIDKPAGVTCPNLDNRGACKIHENLKNKGFSGCIAYDCHGAGQRVVQDLYDGISWQANARLLEQMSEDFAKMRRLHSWIELLFAAQKLQLSPPLLAECTALLTELYPRQSWNRTRFDALNLQTTGENVSEFLAKLRNLI